MANGEAWRIESAGTWGLDGRGMTEEARVALEELGIEVNEHIARTVDLEMLRSFDIILTMEKSHKEALRAEFPEIAGRVYLLSEMVGKQFDIRDPIGEPLDEFRKTAWILSQILDKGFDQILELTGTWKIA